MKKAMGVPSCMWDLNVELGKCEDFCRSVWFNLISNQTTPRLHPLPGTVQAAQETLNKYLLN